MSKCFAYFIMILAAAPAFAVPGTSAMKGPRFGAPFPSSSVSSIEPAAGCGERYRFSTSASLPTVADFYLTEGRQAGLELIGNSDASDPSYRMITFMKPHGHEVLFVTLSAKTNVTKGTVFFTPANALPCR